MGRDVLARRSAPPGRTSRSLRGSPGSGRRRLAAAPESRGRWCSSSTAGSGGTRTTGPTSGRWRWRWPRPATCRSRPEYRRTGGPGGGWPGTFDDVAAAVRGGAGPCVAPAVRRRCWPGHSAGGHLALWAGGGAGPGGRPAAAAVGGAGSGGRPRGRRTSSTWTAARSRPCSGGGPDRTEPDGTPRPIRWRCCHWAAGGRGARGPRRPGAGGVVPPVRRRGRGRPGTTVRWRVAGSRPL